MHDKHYIEIAEDLRSSAILLCCVFVTYLCSAMLLVSLTILALLLVVEHAEVGGIA